MSVRAVFAVHFEPTGREPVPDPLRLEYSDEDYRTDSRRAEHDRSTYSELWERATDYATSHFCPVRARRVTVEVIWL